jgi:hypothetical protein
MRKQIPKGVLFVALMASVVGVAVASRSAYPASAQAGGTYDLTWNTIDSGGYTFSTGGTYSLGGTIGQPDAGVLSGGSYSLSGGVWGSNTTQQVYLPVILR